MAQQQQIPIVFREALNLLQLGVNGDNIKFGSASMESDKFITVCENVNGQSNVVIVDMSQGNTVTRRPITAEAAIMNPVSKVIALRAGSQLQIFNMELRAKMKDFQITEQVAFWRWISPNMIGLVSPSGVYHWSIEGDSPPMKVFDRNAALGEGTQIISYRVSDDQKWSLLIGISQGAGGIQGNMQLYSHEKKASQVLQGHSGAFTTIAIPGRADRAQVLSFVEKKPNDTPKLYVMEVGRDPALGAPFRLAPQAIPFPPDAAADFPVTMQASSKHGIIYMITKLGFLYMFDIHSGTTLFRTRISQDTVFTSCQESVTGGMLGITARKGQVLHITLNEQTLVPYIVNTLRNNQLAISLAARLGLPGAEDLYMNEFNRLVAANDVQGAARLAAESPQGVLRTPATIERFKAMPPEAGKPQPLMHYFSTLLEKGKLNRMESLELARPVLAQGRGQLLEKWLTEDKLECSEELGDMVVQTDTNMALSVYLRANAPEKVINCFVQRGEFDKIVAYASKVGYQCDWTFMLQNLVRVNPQAAMEFAQKLAANEGGSLVDVNSVVDIFMQMNRIQEVTAFLLEALKGNKKEEGYLQTRLLEINLLGGAPQVADAIMQNEMFTHYDRLRVAQLCEKAGLLQRALEHFTELTDIKRALHNASTMNQEWLITFFGSLTTENSLECLRELLNSNIRQNLNTVVEIAKKYSDQLSVDSLIALFEKFNSWEGLYFYLGSIVNFSQEPSAHFKYIQAAAKMGQFKEVERVCRDSTVYEPVAVKEMLKELKLPDPRPLIHVCDRYDFVEEMTQYLYSNNLLKYIEVYAQKVSPQKTPMVVGKLLDLDCNEDFVKGLLNSVGQMCPVDELVEQVERRNRLRLLQPWLEARVAQGNTETATHNAMGKIYITLNRDPQSFLENNQFYDSAVVGIFCEKLDPSLAFLAYRRAGGACDDDLIRVTNENGLFKDQARYLVERQDLDLWGKVLAPLSDGEEEPVQRRQLIDQVVQTALPESSNPEEVSTTVKAFMSADLPSELMELLERIVLQGSDFADNRNLQNLLILTAIRADSGRVMDYINRLDNFDGPEIAKIAVGEQYNLHEEAFVIYKKFEHNVEAIDVLLEYMEALERAYEFADRCNQPEVWSKLARAQLDSSMVPEAVQSYIKADDASNFNDVIDAAERVENYEALVDYLRMARNHVKESHLDTELVYSLAKVQKLAELEEFISAPNVAQIQSIGERLYDEGMFNAAKILFNSINNNAKLALCHVHLGEFREAVEAATKANAVSSWKEVNQACVSAGEFRLATICGLHIIVHPDHLEELILHYERQGHPDELIQLMEQGLGLESAHAGVFTELGVLYSKYNPTKLMEHIKIFWSRMNIPKLLRACETGQHWEEATFLYKEDGQVDNAVRIMTDHPSAFAHDLFLDCVQKVRNQDVHYKAISFYLEQHPMQLVRLLQVLTPNLDHARVVHLLRKADQLPLVLPYLKSVQKENLSAVNEAINEVLVDDEQYENLRVSVDDHDNFDQIALAQKLEKHELLEFRRIAAYLFKKNKRWAQSMKLSKEDNMYKDAIDTAAESNDPELAEELLRFFVSVHDKECFAATLYTCYTLVSPDVAIELAWRENLVDFVMPYVVQYVRHLHDRVAAIDERTQPQEEQAPIPEEVMDQGGYGMYNNGMLQIANSAYNPGMDMNQQSYMQQGGMDPAYMQQQQQQQMMMQSQMGGGGMYNNNMGGM